MEAEASRFNSKMERKAYRLHFELSAWTSVLHPDATWKQALEKRYWKASLTFPYPIKKDGKFEEFERRVNLVFQDIYET